MDNSVRDYSVREYADLLGVTPRRVRALIEAGSIRAEKVSGVWRITDGPPSVPKSSLSGPRLSSESFDRLADLLDLRGKALTPAERYACTKRAKRILEGGLPTAVAYAQRKGMSVHHFEAAVQDVAELRTDSRVMPTGISHPLAAIASNAVDVYVLTADYEAVIAEYFLEEAPLRRRNVTLRKVEVMPPRLGRLHVLTDLAGDGASRSIDAANRILAEVESDFQYV